MTKPRDNDNQLIEDAEKEDNPSQQGSSGGDMARKVGQRDEAKSAAGGDPLPTSVDGRDKPEKGDMPSPPERRK